MQNLIKSTVLAVSVAMAGAVVADERPDHFEGLPSPDLQTAVENFSEYNNRLEKVLAGELTDVDLAKIHELTYTLENALEKMNSEMEELAETLEKVHVASETDDREALKEAGPAYLKTSRILVR